MSFMKDLSQLLRPYYIINIIISLSYLVCKKYSLICNYVFATEECELDSRETEILFFLMIVIMIRTRKTGSVTMINYLSSSFIYTKIANLILWFYADIRYGLIFGAIFILCGLVLPEPTYSGPENIIYFRGLDNMEEEFQRDKKVVWLVCFYAAWHPACVTFAPIFSELSAEYSLQNMKFGKLDVGRFPEAAAKYRIIDGPTSRQLPTLILFKEASEYLRRPEPDHKNKLIKFSFSIENVKAAFTLSDIHKDCKTNQTSKTAQKKTN